MPSATCAPSTPSTAPRVCARAACRPDGTSVAAAPGRPDRFILAVDQGTTGSRSLLFDARGHVVAMAQKEFKQHFPQPGWVEHDALEIFASQLATIVEVLNESRVSVRDIAAVGITNQRETTILWDRKTGEPVAP